MHYKLINFINDLCIKLSGRYHINCGGCCYLAYLLAKNLEQLNIRYDFVIEEYGIKSSYRSHEFTKLELRKAIKSNKRRINGVGFISCCHYTVKIDGILCNTIPNSNWQSISVACIKPEHILSIYDKGHWNDTYNTDNNPIIERIVNYAFKKYEKSQN